MEIVSWFSNRLQAERKRLKLSVREVAKACEVTAAKWTRFEKGEEAPEAKTLFLFAELGADMNYVFKAEFLDKEEIQLIEKYREADLIGKAAIDYVAQGCNKGYAPGSSIQCIIKFLE
ncbi:MULTISPECIES: helix-turn-helix domain-containing protein [Neisseria]|uniref:helix-turn-helix domain-containing protein n=1 Tax=Neisseria TaxID=482 RepID=UPI000E59484B|nr:MULTISPECIES: helix-turn-helix transcriptional regulator [Neisseria]